MIGVKNQIDTGARGVERRLAAAGMRHRLLAEAVNLANHDLRLFLSEGRDQLAIVAPLDAVERDFDAIDTVLDLTADLLDRLSDGSHQLADRGFGRADPARVPIGQALMGGDITARRHDTGPVEKAGADCVTDRQADLAGVARRADCGKSGRGDLLSEEHAAQGAELERAVKVDVLLALRVAVGEMRVDVDQPGHDETAGIIEHLVAAGAPRRGSLRAGILDDALVIEDQDFALKSIVFASGEELTAANKCPHCR